MASAYQARAPQTGALPPLVVLLVAAVQLFTRDRLPVPLSVEVYTAQEGPRLEVRCATRAHVDRWTAALGLPVSGEWHCHPYINPHGVACTITSVYGRWRDAQVNVRSVEPVDVGAALRGGDAEAGR